MIILDLGNGSVLKNRWENIKATIDAIARIDTNRECIIKFQLFSAVPPKEPLRRDLFYGAFQYGEQLGFTVTSSAFDYDALDFLARLSVPMIKLANRSDSRIYFDEALERFEAVAVSTSDAEMFRAYEQRRVMPLACVSEYPADPKPYKERFLTSQLHYGISDHTMDLKLYREYKPMIYEKHFVLDSVSSDAPRHYALRPDGLEELLWYTR